MWRYIPPENAMGESQEVPAEMASTSFPSNAPCWKFVVDNIDSTVNPRCMREDAQSKSLHYVQVYAVKDRIDYSTIIDPLPSGEKNIFNILPTSNDYEKIKENMAILVSRIIADHIRFFAEDYKSIVTRHILHKYTSQMSQKSEVVSYIYSTSYADSKVSTTH